MEGEAAVVTDFQDWELLANSDSDVMGSPTNSSGRDFREIDADSAGMIKLDYFSLENGGGFAKTLVEDVSEDDGGSVERGHPSWGDRFRMGSSVELWADPGSDRSDERKLSDVDGKTELGFVESVKNDVGFEGVSEIGDKEGKAGEFEAFEGKIEDVGGNSELGLEETVKSQENFEVFSENQNQSKDKDLVMFWSDSGGEGLASGDVVKAGEESETENLGGLEEGDCSQENSLSVVAESENKNICGGEGEKRKVVWWKVPFEMLRYCVLRVSPVWTFSMAAAVMGFVILGRRLYKMKRKTRSMQIKVAVDDKKQGEEQQVNCDSDNSTGFRRSEAAMGGVSSRIFNREEGVCGFCVFMKGGPCRDPFIAWDHCLLEAETSNEDAVDKCAEVTRTLHKCMQAHPEYYELDDRARKAAEEKAKEQTEKENVAKEAEKIVAIKISDTAEKKMDEKAVKEVGSNAADKEMEKETAWQKNRN